jgi:hypothetical protein
MKKTRLHIFLVFALMAFPLVSMGQNLNLGNFFTKSQQVTINKIIDYYDSIVMTRTHHKYDIKHAYYYYFDSIFPSVIKSGKLSLATITGKQRIKFLSSLNQKALKEIYIIKDSASYSTHGRVYKMYSPYTLKFNSHGAYAQLLESLSKENSFLNGYCGQIIKNGNFGPSSYATILNASQKFDFGDRLQRLLVIVNLLLIN